MHRLLGAELAAQHFVGPIGDHLVEVHVGLGAGPGLPDHQRKMPVELAVDHLARGADNGAGAAPVEQPEFAIGFGRGRLTMPSARTIGIGIRSSPMRKFRRDRSVCAPQ